MEKLDYTLYNMLKNKIFTNEHLVKLKQILERLNKTIYRHDDLHLNNIMWSDDLKDFRIIDCYYKTKNNQKFKQSPKLVKKVVYRMNNTYKLYKCFGFKVCRVKL